MQFGLRTMLFVVLLLVMLVLSYPLLFKPLNAERDSLILDTQKNQKKLADLSGAMDNTKDMPAEIAKLNTAIEFLTSKLPAATEMDKVLNEVTKAAIDNKLIIKSVRNGKITEGPNYNEQPIRLVIAGPFHPGFFKFLRTVEQMQRLTKINNMKIDSDDKNNGYILADLELTIFSESSQKVAVAQ